MSHFLHTLYQSKINFGLRIYNTLTVCCKNSITVSFVSSYKKNIALLLARSSFSVSYFFSKLLLLDQHQVLIVYLNLL